MHFLIVSVIKPDAKGTAQYNWQSNLFAAEEFVWGEKAYDNIILGSSLSNRITPEMLPADQDWYNLSLAGLGVFDGLELIRQSNNVPQNVYIEVNKIMREPSSVFHKAVFAKSKTLLRDHLSYSFESQKPIPLIEKAFEDKVVRKTLGKMEHEFLKLPFFRQPTKGGLEKQEKAAMNEDAFAQIKQKLVQQYGEIDEQKLSRHLTLLSKQVAELEDRGIRVVFFEIPIESSICNLKRSVSIRNGIKTAFSNQYIEQPDCSTYQTTDGLHLNNKSAVRYVEFFINNI